MVGTWQLRVKLLPASHSCHLLLLASSQTFVPPHHQQNYLPQAWRRGKKKHNPPTPSTFLPFVFLLLTTTHNNQQFSPPSSAPNPYLPFSLSTLTLFPFPPTNRITPTPSSSSALLVFFFTKPSIFIPLSRRPGSPSHAPTLIASYLPGHCLEPPPPNGTHHRHRTTHNAPQPSPPPSHPNQPLHPPRSKIPNKITIHVS